MRKLARKVAKASEAVRKKKSPLQTPTQKAGICVKPETMKEERLSEAMSRQEPRSQEVRRFGE
ncbi:hypothetical protein ASG89_11805 [Paenibacillus sp. Soil766]|nr:hypothetical protein ASG89_11805 [Paenibacillus sp. Soil766]